MERILDAFPVGTRVYGYLFYAERIYTTTGLPVNEPIAVGEISRSGKVLIPSDVSTNLTVHSRFPPVAQSPPWDDQPRAVDAGKTYVAFLISDGDNLGYNQQALRTRHWDDPARGSIPIGVSISPFLATHAPRIYDYYVRTMAPNEVLVMGPSGAGYIYPQYHPDIGGYLAETCRLIDLTGLPAVWILDNGYAASPTPLITDRYVEALAPSAIFADYFGALTPNPPPVYFQRGVPVVHALFGLDVPTTVERVRLAAASFPGRPAFVLVALNTWSMGYSQAAEVMRQLGPSYEVARPDHFVGLLKTAYGEKGSAASQRSCEPNPGPCANERFGTVGPDHLRGTIAGDLTRGRDGDDAIEGRGGADCLFGNRDDDALRGGRGDDRLNGGGGHDSLNGGRGKDRVVGRRGDDRLAGNAGGDKIRAGRGDDRIDAAGGGHDIVSCGQGRDRVRADAGDSLAGCEDVERSRARRAQLARETNSPMMAP